MMSCWWWAPARLLRSTQKSTGAEPTRSGDGSGRERAKGGTGSSDISGGSPLHWAHDDLNKAMHLVSWLLPA